MGESIIGDITPSDGISREDKHLREGLAILYLSALIRSTHPTFAAEVQSLWQEYEERKTMEAQLVRDIDIYERLLQAYEYEKRSRRAKDLGDFFEGWEEMITTPEIRRWTEALVLERQNFWSGGPGAGKGTQCARFAQEFGFQHLSVGDLLREEIDRPGSPFATFISESIRSSVIIPAQLTVSLIKAKMDMSNIQSKRRFLIDGYPRSMDQALTFEEEIQDRVSVICLDCSDDEMLRRLIKRAESSGRIDDNSETFKKRLDTYQKESTPVIDHLRKRGSVKMLLELQQSYNFNFGVSISSMDHALAQWRRFYHVEDNAFESLMGIILTHGPQQTFSTGDRIQSFPRGVPPKIPSDYFTGNNFGGTADSMRAPLIAPTTFLSPQPHSNTMAVQGLELGTDPYMGYVSPVQDAMAAPLTDNLVSATVQGVPQSSVAASPKTHLRSCVNCWAAKKKCDLGTLCKRCIGPTRTQLPYHLCLRIRLVDEGLFSKWAEPSYKSKLVWESLVWGPVEKTAFLTHERGGPTLQVQCREFLATSEDQTQLFWKETTGWNWTCSTTYGLDVPNIDLRQYIDDCASFLLKGSCQKADYLGQIFQLAQLYRKDPMIRLALRLWAANRLLMKGWEIYGQERLGMKIVDRIESPLHGSVPAPRVLQNQLDHLLEYEIVETERHLLKNLQKVLKASDRKTWVATFLAIAIILHVMERDAWRLLYWVNHQEQVRPLKADVKRSIDGVQINTWRHPLGPRALIKKSVHFGNLLLAHFHYAARGLVPLTLDWDDEKHKELVNDNTTIITSMQAIQQHAKVLGNSSAVGQKGRDRYREKDESSLDFTLSSLVLVDTVRYADFGDFIN
ncbi:MAG: hypothetical protein Q9196_003692 [Gyalolechia fulgens]